MTHETRDTTGGARDWLWLVVAGGAVAGAIGELVGVVELRLIAFGAASVAVAGIIARAVVRRTRGSSWNDSLWG